MQILTEIPFDLDSLSLMKRAHVTPDSDDAVEFERLVQTARMVARPKAGYLPDDSQQDRLWDSVSHGD